MRLLLTALLALPLLASCDAMDVAPPHIAADIEARDQRIAALEIGIKAEQARHAQAVQAIVDLRGQLGKMSSEQIMAEFNALVAEGDDALAAWESKVTEWDAEVAAQNAVVDSISTGILGPLEPMIPDGPWKPLLLFAPLLFKRPRKHAGAAIEHGAVGAKMLFTGHAVEAARSAMQAAKSVAKIPGLIHSDEHEQPGPKDTPPKS